jgi:hypothetical protein
MRKETERLVRGVCAAAGGSQHTKKRFSHPSHPIAEQRERERESGVGAAAGRFAHLDTHTRW